MARISLGTVLSGDPGWLLMVVLSERFPPVVVAGLLGIVARGQGAPILMGADRARLSVGE